MRKMTLSILAIVLLSVFASGCAPASTPIPSTSTPISTETAIPVTLTATPLPTKTATPVTPTASPTPIPPTTTSTPATPIVCVQVIIAFEQEFVVYPLIQQGDENKYLPSDEPTKFQDGFSLPLLEDSFFRCKIADNDAETKASAVAEDKTVIEIKEGPNGVIQMKGLKLGTTNVEIRVSEFSYTFTGILVEEKPK